MISWLLAILKQTLISSQLQRVAWSVVPIVSLCWCQKDFSFFFFSWHIFRILGKTKNEITLNNSFFFFFAYLLSWYILFRKKRKKTEMNRKKLLVSIILIAFQCRNNALLLGVQQKAVFNNNLTSRSSAVGDTLISRTRPTLPPGEVFFLLFFSLRNLKKSCFHSNDRGCCFFSFLIRDTDG